MPNMERTTKSTKSEYTDQVARRRSIYHNQVANQAEREDQFVNLSYQATTSKILKIKLSRSNGYI